MDPWQRKYHRERNKRIRDIMHGQAAIKGGQGRSAESVHKDGLGVAFALVAIVLLVVVLVLAS